MSLITLFCLFITSLFVFGMLGVWAYKNLREKSVWKILERFIILSQKDFQNVVLSETDKKAIISEIEHIIFVHGTFVGDDPFSFWNWVEKVFLPISKISNGVRSLAQKSVSKICNDVGNFSQAHIEKVQELFQEEISCEKFLWSSANNHFARLQAAIKLSLKISNLKTHKILLVGHSHAAQVFSLVSMLQEKKIRQTIQTLFADDLKLIEDLSQIKKIDKEISVITLGAPSRYPFQKKFYKSMTHFINHRGSRPYPGHFSGVMTTRDGDYVQQWAKSGSDFGASREAKKLDPLLGESESVEVLKKEIAMKNARLHSEGINILIDYGDSSKFVNWHKSILGHTIYTKVDLLEKHLSLWVDRLPKEKNSK